MRSVALELPVRPRVRLPDALPEFDAPSAPHRGRAAVLVVSFVAYAAVVAVGVGLTYGAFSIGAPSSAEQSPPSHDNVTATAAAASPSVPSAPGETPASAVPSATASATHVEPTPARSRSLPSCERAAETYKDDLSEGSTALPRDMTGSAYGALSDGPATQRLLTQCAARGWRHADICVAVRGFRAVGVTVHTDPPDGAVERCVTDTLAALTFSHQPVLKLIRSEIALLPKR